MRYAAEPEPDIGSAAPANGCGLWGLPSGWAGKCFLHTCAQVSKAAMIR